MILHLIIHMPNYLNVYALVTKIQLCSHYFLDHPRIPVLRRAILVCQGLDKMSTFLNCFSRLCAVFTGSLPLTDYEFSIPHSLTLDPSRDALCVADREHDRYSHLVGKPTMWFPNTNRPVQAQKRARSLKFRI